MLGITKKDVVRLINQKKLTAFNHHGNILVSYDEVLAMINNQTK